MRFSNISKKRLKECDPRLQDIFNEAINIIDISIICGHRKQEEQHNAFVSKHSMVDWPNSKHNSKPSLAVDVVPYPTMWENREMFYMLNGVVQTVAKQKNINVLWGGNFKTFDDLAHWEIIDE